MKKFYNLGALTFVNNLLEEFILSLMNIQVLKLLFIFNEYGVHRTLRLTS